MSYKSFIKDCSISLLISISIIGSAELIMNVFNIYKTKTEGDTKCKIYDEVNDISKYRSNCLVRSKHWENDRWVEYRFNSFGRRDGEINKNISRKIASIGDSFTMGALVPIEDNYNYYAFNTILKGKYQIHNYGVSGEEWHNIRNKLTFYNWDDYDFILYGLTPNDLTLLCKKYIKRNSNKYGLISNRKFVSSDENINYLKFRQTVKKILKSIPSTSISRFALHSAMSNDDVYYKTWVYKGGFNDGYVNSSLSNSWIFAFKEFESDLKTLPSSVKSKLKIFLLPQRAQVVSEKLKRRGNQFESLFMDICKRQEIDCSFANINQLSKLKESHFPIDGHLNISGNHSVGRDLAKWAIKWGDN